MLSTHQYTERSRTVHCDSDLGKVSGTEHETDVVIKPFHTNFNSVFSIEEFAEKFDVTQWLQDTSEAIIIMEKETVSL